MNPGKRLVETEKCGFTWNIGFCVCVLPDDHQGPHECKCFDTLPRGTSECPVCLDGPEMPKCSVCNGKGRIIVI